MENKMVHAAPQVFRSARNRPLRVVGEREVQAPQPTPPPTIQPSTDPAREKALAAKEASLTAALATVHAAFAILGSRALVVLTALASIGAFGWTLADPSGLRLGAACLVTVLLFLPSLWADLSR